MTSNLNSWHEDLQQAADILRKGGVILYPTDTIWGIGCDASNDDAVKRVFQIKQRADSKAMISLVDSVQSLQKWVKAIPTTAQNEIEGTERPLTIIYEHPDGISHALKATDGSAAFRITSADFTQELCRMLDKPLVSTSANVSGMPSPKTYDEIDELLKEKVDYICRYGRTNSKAGKPSRIIKISDDNTISIIRE